MHTRTSISSKFCTCIHQVWLWAFRWGTVVWKLATTYSKCFVCATALPIYPRMFPRPNQHSIQPLISSISRRPPPHLHMSRQCQYVMEAARLPLLNVARCGNFKIEVTSSFPPITDRPIAITRFVNGNAVTFQLDMHDCGMYKMTHTVQRAYCQLPL